MVSFSCWSIYGMSVYRKHCASCLTWSSVVHRTRLAKQMLSISENALFILRIYLEDLRVPLLKRISYLKRDLKELSSNHVRQ